jgi:hypothetical protein
MALYEDYLNQNNLYSRPSSLVSDVNNYLGANQAKLPLSSDSLGNMANLKIDPTDPEDRDSGGYTVTKDDSGIKDPEYPGDKHRSEGDIYGSGEDLLSKFVKDLGVLDEGQQNLLLQFIGTDGVSSDEYAELFGVDEDYANRFQGFPTLLDIKDQIDNVYAFGAERRGSEQRAAQQAMRSDTLMAMTAGRGFSGMGRRGGGGSNALRRKAMEDTLKQRLSAAGEATASKYGQLLSSVQRQLSGGFQAAANILQENPGATTGNPGNLRVGETRNVGGELEYWDGSTWVDYETYMRNSERD